MTHFNVLLDIKDQEFDFCNGIETFNVQISADVEVEKDVDGAGQTLYHVDVTAWKVEAFETPHDTPYWYIESDHPCYDELNKQARKRFGSLDQYWQEILEAIQND